MEQINAEKSVLKSTILVVDAFRQGKLHSCCFRTDELFNVDAAVRLLLKVGNVAAMKNRGKLGPCISCNLTLISK